MDFNGIEIVVINPHRTQKATRIPLATVGEVTKENIQRLMRRLAYSWRDNTGRPSEEEFNYCHSYAATLLKVVENQKRLVEQYGL